MFPLKLESNTDLADAVVNITADVSALESTAITVSGDIIRDLTDAAIEEPEVIYSNRQTNGYIYCKKKRVVVYIPPSVVTSVGERLNICVCELL